MRRRLFLSGLVAALMLAPGARAVTFTVDRFDDAVDAAPADGSCNAVGGGCTLRAALMESNASGGGHTIQLAGAEYRLSLTSGPDDATAGDLDATLPVTIQGVDMRETVISAAPGHRVLEVHLGSALLQFLTLRGGADAGGGGVRVRHGGALVCVSCVIRDNRSSTNGGGVETLGSGRLRLFNSIVGSNSAASCGGGIAVAHETQVFGSQVTRNLSAASGGGVCAVGAAGQLFLFYSTVDGNVASAKGGGVELLAGSHALYNSTLSGNRAARGGGLHLNGIATLQPGSGQLTIADNRATVEGGGVWVEATTTLDVSNSLLGDNLAPAGEDCLGTVVSGAGHNLVEETSGCVLAGTTTGNVTALDPLLLPLRNAGYLTPTHELASELSPAFDAGADGFSNIDQRQYGRPNGTHPEIGATELYGIVPESLEQVPGLLEMNGQTGLATVVRNLYSRGRMTVTGSLLWFTGPAGPSYAIPDGTASYGQVFGGTTSSCASTGDCYQIRTELPWGQSRPTAHFDALAQESAGPAANFWRVHLGGSFLDTPPLEASYPAIESLLHARATAGCGAKRFCPGDGFSRRQLALLLERIHWGEFPLPFAASGTVFVDVPASDPYAEWIERFAAHGMSEGCAPDPDSGGPLLGRFCPDGPVRKDQLTRALLRMRDGASSVPPPCIAAPFLDVSPSDPHCRWIAAATRESIVKPCVPDPDGPGPLLGRFCPAAPATREQVALWLWRGFELPSWSLGL